MMEDSNMPNVIRAPFNFVPLNNEVFFPDWADKISHDVPFSDGISGQIELTITAETPIFIGDGKSDAPNNHDPLRFAQLPDGRYFIPGTSLKGAIRNVLEVLSFGKMSRVQNRRFSVRDLNDRNYRTSVSVGNVCCGWLTQVGDSLYLEDHGKPWRIRYNEIDEWLHCELVKFAESGDFANDSNRKAARKYKLLGRERDKIIRGRFSAPDELGYVRYLESGEEGVLVMTGQSSRRSEKIDGRTGKSKKVGKFTDFIFPSKVEREMFLVDPRVAEAFLQIHAGTPTMELWDKEFRSGEPIPVFFTCDSKNKVVAIGLAFMFRFPANLSVYDAMKNDLHDEDKHDLAECLFGWTSRQSSLRGRVSFSHAIAQGSPSPMDPVSMVLSTPHPSYYPLYVSGGTSWDAQSASIAGRKRYPTRSRVIAGTVGTDEMTTVIRPLPQGTSFKGIVRFHNLRPAELGALLAAMTFNGQEDCRHNIGMGKPLGYGKVRMAVQMENADSFISDFRSMMSVEIPNWSIRPQLNELYDMAIGIPDSMSAEFSYMSMDSKEFYNAKRDGRHLDSFGSLTANDLTLREARARRIKQQTDSQKEIDLNLLDTAIKNKNLQQVNALLDSFGVRYSSDAKFKSLEQQAKALNDDFEQIKGEALQAKSAGSYSDAISLYQQAAAFGVKSFESEIAQCEAEIKKAEERNSQPVEDWVQQIKVASIKAFPNNFKSRKPTDDELPVIADYLSQKVSEMKSKEQKDWKNFDKWVPIKNAIGEAMAKKLFDLAFGEDA